MSRLSTFAMATAFMFSSNAWASALTIHNELPKFRRLGGVVFPITNNTGQEIRTIFGKVYGYEGDSPEHFTQVNNPNVAAEKLTAGPHAPGTRALYRFSVPYHRLSFRRYGLVVFDVSIRRP